MKTIYFDMDGTIADLYGDEDWLDKVKAKKVEPYLSAKPLYNMASFARKCLELQKKGYELGIISWTPPIEDETYIKAVAMAKVKWLVNHLPSVNFDKIYICDYKTDKSQFGDVGDILFDDEIQNREDWETIDDMVAYDPNDIIKTLCSITKEITPLDK